MLSRRLGVPGAESLARLSLLLACSPLSTTDAAFLICSVLGIVAVLSVEVRVARTAASAAALMVVPVGDSTPLLLCLSLAGMSHMGICVLAIVVLPLLMYSLTSDNCMTQQHTSHQ
jgi:hypothetical protein